MQDVAALFERQAAACDALGSPFMGQFLQILGQNITPGSDVLDRLVTWDGDASAHGDAIALRLAGALHALVLTGAAPELTAIYPPNPLPTNHSQVWAIVRDAINTHHDHILQWFDTAPQTNEVRRSTAMICAAHVLAARFPNLPFRLSELGASAGLNLYWDHFALVWPDGSRIGPQNPVITLSPQWRNAAPSVATTPIRIADRRGVDLNPLDPGNPQDQLRLRSYTWPDQSDRMARLDAVLAIAAPIVDRGDAAQWLAERLARPQQNQIDLVFHTIAWQYFPPQTDAACRATLNTAGARATVTAPLAHLWVETDNTDGGATLRLTIWAGGDPEILNLGRISPHGIWIDWTAR